jgi:hypothetical protein
MKPKKVSKPVKPIKAWAVIFTRLNDYYTYDNREGGHLAHAFFPKRIEAQRFAKYCTAAYGEQKPRVIPIWVSPFLK